MTIAIQLFCDRILLDADVALNEDFHGILGLTGAYMPTKPELNLVGVVWPVCLLQCSSELNRLYAGDEIDVIVQDPNVLKDLSIILERSSDHSVTTSKDGEQYRLHVLKL